MTKQEFYNFVDSFNGQYDDTTLLVIGKKFRELPVKERTWQELVDYLKIDRSANGFRQWVYRNEDIVDEAIELANTSNESIIDNEDPVVKQRNEYKDKAQNRAILTAYRRLIREESRIDSLKESIVDYISDDKKVYGLRCIATENNYGNPYDYETYRVCGWHEIRPITHGTTNFGSNQDVRINFINSEIESLIHKYYAFGVNMKMVNVFAVLSIINYMWLN